MCLGLTISIVLSLLAPRGLQETHHLIVVECGGMNEFVCGIVHLAQILEENVVQTCARYLLTPLRHNH